MSAVFLDDDGTLTGVIAVDRPDDLATRARACPRARPARCGPRSLNAGCPGRVPGRAAGGDADDRLRIPSPAEAATSGTRSRLRHRRSQRRQARWPPDTARARWRPPLVPAGRTLACRGRPLGPLVVCDRRRRRYRLLFEDPRLDVWVLSWMPGQGTGFHDHGDSNVALTALQGSVVERRCGSARRASSASSARPLPAGAGRIHPFRYPRGRRAGRHAARVFPPLVDVGQYRALPRASSCVSVSTGGRSCSTTRSDPNVKQQLVW